MASRELPRSPDQVVFSQLFRGPSGSFCKEVLFSLSPSLNLPGVQDPKRSGGEPWQTTLARGERASVAKAAVAEQEVWVLPATGDSQHEHFLETLSSPFLLRNLAGAPSPLRLLKPARAASCEAELAHEVSLFPGRAPGAPAAAALDHSELGSTPPAGGSLAGCLPRAFRHTPHPPSLLQPNSSPCFQDPTPQARGLWGSARKLPCMPPCTPSPRKASQGCCWILKEFSKHLPSWYFYLSSLPHDAEKPERLRLRGLYSPLYLLGKNNLVVHIRMWFWHPLQSQVWGRFLTKSWNLPWDLQPLPSLILIYISFCSLAITFPEK